MPASVSSMPIDMLLATTSSGVRAALAQAMAQIMSVKPGPSVPDVTAISPVTRMKASAACAIDPSWRPPKAGMPAEAMAWITG